MRKNLLTIGLSLVLLSSTLVGLKTVGVNALEKNIPSVSLNKDIKINDEIILTKAPKEIGRIKSENFSLLNEISAFNGDKNYGIFYTTKSGENIDHFNKLVTYPVNGSKVPQLFGPTASNDNDKMIKTSGYYVYQLEDIAVGQPGLKICMMKEDLGGRNVHFELREVSSEGKDVVVGFSEAVTLAIGNGESGSSTGSCFEIYNNNFYVNNELVDFYAYDGKILKAKEPDSNLFKNSYEKLTGNEYKLQMSIETHTNVEGNAPSTVENGYVQVRALRVPNKNVQITQIITGAAPNFPLTIIYDHTGAPFKNDGEILPNHKTVDCVLNKNWVQRGSRYMREHILYNGKNIADEVTDSYRSADINQWSEQMWFARIRNGGMIPYENGDVITLKKGMPFAAGFGIACGIDTTCKSEYVGATTGDTLGRDINIQLNNGKWEIINISLLGGSIRLSEPTGLGFGTEIDKTYYDSLVNKYGVENVKTGTLIITEELLNNNELKYNTPQVLNIENHGWISTENGNYRFRGSVTNIPENKYSQNLVGRGYVSYIENGEIKYIYSKTETRSVKDVALKALEDINNKFTPEQKLILEKYSRSI